MHDNLKFDTRRSRVKHCPCGKSNKDGKFAPYVGFDNKGYCHSCGEVFLPSAGNRFSVHGNQSKNRIPNRSPAAHRSSPAAQRLPIPAAIFTATQQPAQNNFIRFLHGVFGKEVALQLVKRYFIAQVAEPATRNSAWKGATVFWQINAERKVCAGKVMLYNAATGKRVKERNATWIHSIEQIEGYKLHQCLFGEHLLNEPGNAQKPVAIAESEKTAIIASVYLPQFVWLASGGKTMLSAEKCAVLQGRNVTLFPDANAFFEWKAIANRHGFHLSDMHERYSTEAEKESGIDLADYLLRFNPSTFREELRVPSSGLRVDDANEPVTLSQPVTFSDILDVQQYLHEIAARRKRVPEEVWKLFWDLYDNRCDGAAWGKLVAFIAMN